MQRTHGNRHSTVGTLGDGDHANGTMKKTYLLQKTSLLEAWKTPHELRSFGEGQ